MITLASDFGSPYPAAMKGVICRRTDARLVDIAHDLPRQDVRAAAFWLRFVLPEFPPAAHLVVVDPGVGTDRAALAVRAGEHVLVGPDNGVLFPPTRALADGGPIEAFEIRIDDPESDTFHGRDVFAPAAAEIHAAVFEEPRDSPDDLKWHPLLTPTDEYEDLRLPDPDLRPAEALGEVLVVDDFGNAITNVPGEVVEGTDELRVNGDLTPVVGTFADVPIGERLVTVGSHGYVELDVREGRGDEAFGLDLGADVLLSW